MQVGQEHSATVCTDAHELTAWQRAAPAALVTSVVPSGQEHWKKGAVVVCSQRVAPLIASFSLQLSDPNESCAAAHAAEARVRGALRLLAGRAAGGSGPRALSQKLLCGRRASTHTDGACPCARVAARARIYRHVRDNCAYGSTGDAPP